MATLHKPEQLLDFEVLHAFKKGLSRSNALYFSLLEGQLLVRIYSANRLILGNRYAVSNADEVFYFVMLATDQLELDKGNLHFEFIGPDVQYSEYAPMFKEHMPRLLHISNYLVDTSALSDEVSAGFTDDWFTALAIQCV
jgi:hypothetical protein